MCHCIDSSSACLLVFLLSSIAENKSVGENRFLISRFPVLEQLSHDAFCFVVPANISIVCLRHDILMSLSSTYLFPFY